ncbi:MAG: acylneuraminate cytidylyltransferase family protein [Pseudomonadota bacterium]
MIGGARVLALVTARGGSKGLPRKNLRHLAGRPLVGWSVQAARAARCVDRVVVSTDDGEIADCARAEGAEVPFMRPIDLASDTASSIEVVLHALNQLDGPSFEYVVLLEPTSPLTEGADIDEALAVLAASRDRADAIVGVCRIEAEHPEYDVRITPQGLIRPFQAPDFKHLRRRQEIEELYFLEGTLYASSVQSLREQKSFCHSRTLPFVVPKWKSFEIDDLVDFVCIEAIMAHRSALAAAPASSASVTG